LESQQELKPDFIFLEELDPEPGLGLYFVLELEAELRFLKKRVEPGINQPSTTGSAP
jgi:hypothetical protein